MKQDKNTAKVFQIVEKNYLELFEYANKKQNLDPLEIAILINKTNLNIQHEVITRVKKIRKVSDGPSELIALKFFGIPNQTNGIHIKLKNSRVFWALFGNILINYQYTSLNLEKIIKSSQLFNRMTINQDERSLLAYYAHLVEFKSNFDSNTLVYNSLDKKSVNEYFNTQFKKLKDTINSDIKSIIDSDHVNLKNNQTLIYRGFDIDINQNVRKNRYKIKNENYKKQDSGIGLSYTTDKNIAHGFATQKFTIDTINNSKSIVTCATMRANDAKMSINYNSLNVSDFSSNFNRRCYVASYKIDPNKVLLNLTALNEREILVNPHDLELLEYKQVMRS